MKSLRSLLIIAATSVVLGATACHTIQGPQTYAFTPEEVMSDWDRLSGIGSPYPDTAAIQTSAPRGYKPFYINRMARHGSRYLVKSDQYDNFRTILEDAQAKGVLTDTGKVILSNLVLVSDDAKGKIGLLQDLGRQEHRNTIDRMVALFPEVFEVPEGETVKAEAISTKVGRAIESLYAGTGRLKEIIPNLDLTIFPGDSAVHFSRADHKKNKIYDTSRNAFKGIGDGTRIKAMLFTDSSFLEPSRDSFLVYDFWTAAVGCRLSAHMGVDLFPYLEKEEIYPLWKKRNAGFTLTYGENSKSPLDYSMLIDRMRIQTENALAGHGHNVDLQYGHDSGLMSLCRLLGLEPCCVPIPEGKEVYEGNGLYYWDFNVSPMCGNVMLVFYRRNPADKNILVKVLLNEKEVHICDLKPVKGVYYKWSDVKPYWDARRDVASDDRDVVVVDDTRY